MFARFWHILGKFSGLCVYFIHPKTVEIAVVDDGVSEAAAADISVKNDVDMKAKRRYGNYLSSWLLYICMDGGKT